MRHIDPKLAQWDTTAELLAGVIEMVDVTNRMLFVAHGFKGRQPKPVQIPRPGDAMSEPPALMKGPVSMSSPEAKAFFGGADVIYTPMEN